MKYLSLDKYLFTFICLDTKVYYLLDNIKSIDCIISKYYEDNSSSRMDVHSGAMMYVQF